MGKKLTSLKRYISVITAFDEKKFVIFIHTINHFLFGYDHLPRLQYFFFLFWQFFFLTFFLFSFPFHAIYC